MQFLEGLAGYRLTSYKCNTHTNAELNIYHFGNKTEQWKCNWYNHMLKMKHRQLV